MTDRAEADLRLENASGRVHYGWIAAVLIATLPLTYGLSRETWEAAFPINETVGLLMDSGVMTDSQGAPHSLLDSTLLSFFDPAPRSWFRPLYFVTWYAFWHTTHSLDATLLLFRLLEIITIVLLVAGLTWQVKPRTALDAAAAMVAVSILVGMPGLRENLEIPLPMTLVGMLFALVAWMVLERRWRLWHAPVLVLLTALAVGYKEQGLILVPLIVGAWWAGAPGVRRGTALAITVLTLAYLAMRFTTSASWRPFEQDIGLGFEMISASAAADRFGAFPYWVYLYNAAANVANILFSEPTAGVFDFVQGALDGRLKPRQINHVATSTATTLLLAWWAIHTWRRDASGHWSAELRLVVALVLALAASAALGFNYSRDRLGGMAVVFYALASYYALREAGIRLGQGGALRLVAAALPLLLLSAGWQVRAIGTVDSVQARARRTHREWISTRHLNRLGHATEKQYLRIFAAMEPQGVAAIRERTSEYERRADAWFGPR